MKRDILFRKRTEKAIIEEAIEGETAIKKTFLAKVGRMPLNEMLNISKILKETKKEYEKNKPYSISYDDMIYHSLSTLPKAVDIMIEKKIASIVESVNEEHGREHYRGVIYLGPFRMLAEKAIVTPDHVTGWVNVEEFTPFLKARVILREGDEKTVERLFNKMGELMSDKNENVLKFIRHLLSNKKLQEKVLKEHEGRVRSLDKYCDEAYNKPWPWERKPSVLVEELASRKEAEK